MKKIKPATIACLTSLLFTHPALAELKKGQVTNEHGKTVDYVFETRSQKYALDLTGRLVPSIAKVAGGENPDETYCSVLQKNKDRTDVRKEQVVFTPGRRNVFRFYLLRDSQKDVLESAIRADLRKSGSTADKLSSGENSLKSASLGAEWGANAMTASGDPALMRDIEQRLKQARFREANGDYFVDIPANNGFFLCDMVQGNVEFRMHYSLLTNLEYSLPTVSEGSVRNIWNSLHGKKEVFENPELVKGSTLSQEQVGMMMAASQTTIALLKEMPNADQITPRLLERMLLSLFDMTRWIPIASLTPGKTSEAAKYAALFHSDEVFKNDGEVRLTLEKK